MNTGSATGITGLHETALTASSVTLQWTTSVPATSCVEYSPGTTYDQFAGSDACLTDHIVTLSSLSPRTRYHYRIGGRDAAGQALAAQEQSFVTGAELWGLGSAIVLLLVVAAGLAAAVGLAARLAVGSAGNTAAEFNSVAAPLASAGATAAVVSAIASLVVADRQLRATRALEEVKLRGLETIEGKKLRSAEYLEGLRQSALVELEHAKQEATTSIELLRNAYTDERRAYVDLYLAIIGYYQALRCLEVGTWSTGRAEAAEAKMQEAEHLTLFLPPRDQQLVWDFCELARSMRDKATQAAQAGATPAMLRAVWNSQPRLELDGARDAFAQAAQPVVRRFPRSAKP